jgi:hypothetical protein
VKIQDRPTPSAQTGGREPGGFAGSENPISWKYVQPPSVEDAMTRERVSLSVTRRQLMELPSADLAEIFPKQHYRMIPAVDAKDRPLGVIRYRDFMKDEVAQVKE